VGARLSTWPVRGKPARQMLTSMVRVEVPGTEKAGSSEPTWISETTSLTATKHSGN